MSGPSVAAPEGATCPKASSPALAPASGPVAFPSGLRPTPKGLSQGFAAACRAETVIPCGWRGAGAVPDPKILAAALAGRVRGLCIDVASLHPRSSRVALGRGFLHPVSQMARGQSPMQSPFWKTAEFQGLAAPSFHCFPSRRQVKIAPRPGFRQAAQPRLIHFSPTHLWRMVDNSTIRRIWTDGVRGALVSVPPTSKKREAPLLEYCAGWA
jgi:hypothetical protein